MAKPLFLACVLAAVLWPVSRKLARRFGNRPGLAAGAILFGVVLLLLGPLAGFSAFAAKEGPSGLAFLSNLAKSAEVAALLEKLPGPVEQWAKEKLSSSSADNSSAAKESGSPEARGETASGGSKSSSSKDSTPKPRPEAQSSRGSAESGLSRAGDQVSSAVAATAKAAGSLLFQTLMMLIALFFMLLKGDEFVLWLDGVVPLPRGQTLELLDEFKTVSHAVVVSTAVTATVQALAALLGYWIARVPHPFFFASVTFFVAFVPAVGAASVCLVTALVLFVTGHPYMALFLAIWGCAVVGLVDNLVKPMLIKNDLKMSGAIVFFALVGGISTFGTAGLVIGPVVVSFFLALLRIYERSFKRVARA